MNRLKLSENYKSRLGDLAGISKINEGDAGSLPLNDAFKKVLSLDSIQFFKFIDLMEADIEAYGYDDLNYYEQVIGIDVGSLLDYYNIFGFNHFKYNQTKKLKDSYCKLNNISWDQIYQAAENSNY